MYKAFEASGGNILKLHTNDLELAKNLTSVDVIVGSDSPTLLGDKFSDLGLSPSSSYPTKRTNKDGGTRRMLSLPRMYETGGEC